MEDHSSGFRYEGLIAIAMSVGLFLTVGGFIYLTLTRKLALAAPHGFAGVPLTAALFLYLMTETNVAARIKMSVLVRRQMSVWAAWLAILGIAPALDPQRVTPAALAFGAGPVIAIFSIKALLVRTAA